MPEKRVSQARIVRTYEFPTKPEKQTLGQYLYNSQDGKILGRTAKNWAQLMIFYAAFYTVLAALFAICMQGLLVTLNHQYPKWQLDESRIGTNPGLSYRPRLEDSEISAIEYTAANKTSVAEWVGQINAFLEPYVDNTKLPGGGKNQAICDFNTPPKPGQVCAFDVKNLGECTAAEGFGYNKSTPCIFIKLNRIYGWVPEFYEDMEDLPTDMPEDLASHIRSLNPTDRKQVWISCKELTTNTEDDLLGPLTYLPTRGFPGYYYPYMNVEGYLSPLVAVHLGRPIPHRPISIECRAWAKNIIYRGGMRDRLGSLHLTLRID